MTHILVMIEVPEEDDFAQCAFCELLLVEHTCNLLNCDVFSRNSILSESSGGAA